MKFPQNATWKNSSGDVPVKIVGEYGRMLGVFYYKAESGTGIPKNELVFPSVLARIKSYFQK